MKSFKDNSRHNPLLSSSDMELSSIRMGHSPKRIFRLLLLLLLYTIVIQEEGQYLDKLRYGSLQTTSYIDILSLN